ncbi:hypothetical protein EVA_09333 [gut metagenome]|uniref:Uncharacterized protein n=1 Tax=gut metagenome TaxID=749906 RepID=J9GKF3_9ZZZZ
MINDSQPEIQAPSLSSTIQFDQEFQKFFSESIAVIPDEEPEQHPGFFCTIHAQAPGREQ